MTGPDCAVMCNLINTHTHTEISLILPWKDQYECRRMTTRTGPDCAVMYNLINTERERETGTRAGAGVGVGAGTGTRADRGRGGRESSLIHQIVMKVV